MRYLTFAAFVATVYLANLALQTWGVVPIGLGLTAPAGVFFAGAGFLLRDLLHEQGGRVWVFAAILVGACLSWLVGADATLPGGMVPIAVASGCAFAVSEVADLCTYEPLRKRNLPAAVGASQVVGAAVDSALFLLLAFGSLQFFLGQFVGKTAMALPFVALLSLYRVRVRTA